MAFINSQSLTNALSNERHVVSYTIAGCIVGLLTSLIITLFKFGFETPTKAWLPDGTAEGFESLPVVARFLLPLLGGCVLGTLFYLFKVDKVRVGVPYTVFTVTKLHGVFPVKNTVTQFFGAIGALLTGQSVGQEGPAVHLGAGVACRTAQEAGAPQNSMRIFAGCGVAAAIAAAFNTPLAGVIFAMEVVLFEYTIGRFIPVIMSAVTAATVHHLIHGDSQIDFFQHTPSIALQENLWLVVMAICLACTSSIFVKTTQFGQSFSKMHIIPRFTFAGAITGVFATFAPEIMGTGYDTVGDLYLGNIALQAMFVLLITKVLATGAAVGLGIPGGLIGPSMMMGACIGAIFAAGATMVDPSLAGNTPYYVLLGMAGMMSAGLNAPLAAIIFIVELSFMPQLVFPGLLIVVLANTVHQGVFKLPSIIQLIFEHQGVDVNTSSLTKALARSNVMQHMDNRVSQLRSKEKYPYNTDARYFVFLHPKEPQIATTENVSSEQAPEWREACTIPTTASALQAWQKMDAKQVDELICVRELRDETMVIGVLRKQRLIDFVLNG